jgi:hypothetical protein
MEQMNQEQTNSEQEIQESGAGVTDTVKRVEAVQAAGTVQAADTVQVERTPGDVLRTLPSEAQSRGTRFVSAQAMQAKLFSVYDAAAAAEDALALVQEQLSLTLNRNYYEADEIESMAAQLDTLLALESLGLSEEDLTSEDDLVSED